MSNIKITRRYIDPISFTERLSLEFIPHLEDTVLDDQIGTSMSYAAPKCLQISLPPPPPTSTHPSTSEDVATHQKDTQARPPTPPKSRDASANVPRSTVVPKNTSTTHSPKGRKKAVGLGLLSPTTPRGGRRGLGAHLKLSQVSEHEELNDDSLSDLSALRSIAELSLKKVVEKKEVRFADEVELNEISRLRDSVIDMMFYGSEDLANFRYEAFMEEAGLDIAEYD